MAFEIPKDSLSETIFMDKYAYPGETSWRELAKRVARHAGGPGLQNSVKDGHVMRDVG